MKGSTEPRIWTPPLRELTRETSLGYDFADFCRDIIGQPLLPWQEWLAIHALELRLDGSYRFRTVVTLVGRQNGKALALDTDIPTPEGWKKMGDIHEGDYVFGRDGEPAKVLLESEIFNKPMYRVTFEDGATIDASADHVWTVSTKRSRRLRDYTPKTDRKRTAEKDVHHGEWFEVTTEQMAGDFTFTRKDNGRREYKYRVPLQKPVQYPERDLTVHPYLLGAWLGDGTSATCDITIGEEEIAEMVPLLEACGYKLTRRKVTNERAPLFTIDRHERGQVRKDADAFRNKLAALGVLGNKHVPEIYMTASPAQRLELLQGLMDTDGTCSKAGQCEFTQKSKRLAEQVVELCASLGIKATMHAKEATCNGAPAGTVYRVTFYTTTATPCFKLTRKAARLKDRLRESTEAKSITKVERIPDAPSKCIMVDDPWHLYLAGRQYTATHNTLLTKNLALFAMYMRNNKLVVGTAQSLDTSAEAWDAAVATVEETPLLRAEYVGTRRMQGKFELRLTKDRRYKVASATRKGGRGLSADLVLMDELREHTDWESWGAVTKTTMARPEALVWCISNAGDAKSVVLRHLRAQAHAALGDPDGIAAENEAVPGEDEADLGFFEWSAPPECLTTDRQAWAMANPSLGYGFLTERALASAEATDPEAVFRTECLCQWVTAKVAQPFPDGAWEAGLDPVSVMERNAPRFFGFDVSADRKRASLAVCGMRSDRTWHIEVIQSRAGTGWALEWLQQRAAKSPVNLAIQGRGAPASSFLADIQAIKNVNLTLVEGRDLAIYCGRFYDGVVAASGDADSVPVQHRPQPVLDEAARVAQKKAAGDGAWIWDRRASEVDISPLVACTMAHGLANVGRTETTTTKRFETAYTEARGLLVI